MLWNILCLYWKRVCTTICISRRTVYMFWRRKEILILATRCSGCTSFGTPVFWFLRLLTTIDRWPITLNAQICALIRIDNGDVLGFYFICCVWEVTCCAWVRWLMLRIASYKRIVEASPPAINDSATTHVTCTVHMVLRWPPEDRTRVLTQFLVSCMIVSWHVGIVTPVVQCHMIFVANLARHVSS